MSRGRASGPLRDDSGAISGVIGISFDVTDQRCAEKTIIGAIVAMGHSLGLRVVGEGVETEQQNRILKELGCDEVQGFVHGEPLTPTAVARLLNL